MNFSSYSPSNCRRKCCNVTAQGQQAKWLTYPIETCCYVCIQLLEGHRFPSYMFFVIESRYSLMYIKKQQNLLNWMKHTCQRGYYYILLLIKESVYLNPQNCSHFAIDHLGSFCSCKVRQHRRHETKSYVTSESAYAAVMYDIHMTIPASKRTLFVHVYIHIYRTTFGITSLQNAHVLKCSIIV